MRTIRTIEDYQVAAAEREIMDYERAVAEGRVRLIQCPSCSARVPAEVLAPEEHLCGLGETWE